MLDWQNPDCLSEVEEGEVILISHNRGTWKHADTSRNNCVVVTRRGNDFSEFGPDKFEIESIAAWARFNPPNLTKDQGF